MTTIHADIDALTGLRAALTRFRYAQREVAARGGDTLEAARVSLEAKAGRWRARLEQAQTDLAGCQDQAAAVDADLDCSGYARAAGEAGQRLEQVRSWQQRVDAQAVEYHAAAARFAGVLETDLPRAEEQLAGVLAALRATRGVQTPNS